jgi:hypothetical protein
MQLPNSCWFWRLAVVSMLGANGSVEPCVGQTFKQIEQIGSGIGARLTRTRTEQDLDQRLFASLRSRAAWIDNTGGTPLVYEFAADPIWSRVVFALKDSWLRSSNNGGGPNGALRAPRSIEVTGSRKVLIADPRGVRTGCDPDGPAVDRG